MPEGFIRQLTGAFVRSAGFAIAAAASGASAASWSTLLAAGQSVFRRPLWFEADFPYLLPGTLNALCQSFASPVLCADMTFCFAGPEPAPFPFTLMIARFKHFQFISPLLFFSWFVSGLVLRPVSGAACCLFATS